MWEIVVWLDTDRTPDNSPGLRPILTENLKKFAATLQSWAKGKGGVLYTILMKKGPNDSESQASFRAREAFSLTWSQAFGKIPTVVADRITLKEGFELPDVFQSTDFQWIVVGMGSGMTIGIVIFGLIRLLRG